MITSEGISFMLIKEGRLLVEKRKQTKHIDPGAVTIPGGFVEPGETPEQATRRECKEELGVSFAEMDYVCTLLYQIPWGLTKIHYFAVAAWQGELETNEAEALLWIPLTEPGRLDVEVDRVALGEYMRIYAAGTG
jgi:8-oxo-dGTP diphosphatase